MIFILIHCIGLVNIELYIFNALFYQSFIHIFISIMTHISCLTTQFNQFSFYHKPVGYDCPDQL